MVEKQRMEIAFVYTGERRFENIGKKNNHLHLFQALSESTSFKIIDKCKEDRKNDEFILSGPNQIWDFYKAIDNVKEDIVIRMRTDIWFSKSSIPHVVNEILSTLQGKQNFSMIGSELFNHYNIEYETYDLPENNFKVKTADFMTIANKKVLIPKDVIFNQLKNEKSKSGNRLWQRIRKGSGKYSFGQIYLIRENFREEHLNDEYIAYTFAKGYGKKTQKAQDYYYEHLPQNKA
jgi:hypothetical protein